MMLSKHAEEDIQVAHKIYSREPDISHACRTSSACGLNGMKCAGYADARLKGTTPNPGKVLWPSDVARPAGGQQAAINGRWVAHMSRWF